MTQEQKKYTKSYFAQKARERRALEKKIYEKHSWEKMDGESDKDFRRRFSKRIIVEVDEYNVIQNPMGKIVRVENKDTHEEVKFL